MVSHNFAWVLFSVVIVGLLSIDLFLHRKGKKVKLKEATFWTLFWIGISLCFNFFIYMKHGKLEALQFFTGYVIEKTLSIDNIFVFAVIFSYFRVAKEYRHQILYWGVVGAIFTRLIFIFFGIALITHFHWMIYVLGGILLFSGIKLLRKKGHEEDVGKNSVVRLCRKMCSISPLEHKGRFFIRGKATTLFLVLLVIEGTDIIFALDSIPAILAITTDPFIVFTSNIFAILGLRSLYFVLENVIEKFTYLEMGISAILIFIGLKMILSPFYAIPLPLVLAVIVVLLGAAVVLSLLRKPKEKKER